MSMDWMDYVDDDFTNPEQWHFNPQDLGIENSSLSNNTLDSSYAVSLDLVSDTSEPDIQHMTTREDFHQDTTKKILEPANPMAGLSKLSQRIYSLYSAVISIANSPNVLDQQDTAILTKGPFADDVAFQKLT
ncbi:unnamed protein product [Aureobasidium uvarum]|uniref:Uncharacterized protein n=1 Tax=Aureobasidium uvarum TaxID=2773716 RepID=A0A9N8PTH7_9PEZI|nr:unnamed protein product [Aureobasidium uvarum]